MVRFRVAVCVGAGHYTLHRLDPMLAPAALLSAAVEANVRRTVRDLLESPEGRARTAESEMKLVGAVYDLATGRVRFLD
jgi:carbonic anhydrase